MVPSQIYQYYIEKRKKNQNTSNSLFFLCVSLLIFLYIPQLIQINPETYIPKNLASMDNSPLTMKRSQSEYTKSNSPIVRSPSPVKKSSLFNSKLAYEFNNCEIFNQNMSKSAFGSLQPTKTDAKAIARDLAAEFTK